MKGGVFPAATMLRAGKVAMAAAKAAIPLIEKDDRRCRT
jgi:hypothetical protein